MIKKPRDLLWIVPLVLFVTSPFWQPAVANFLKPRGDFGQPQAGDQVVSSQQFQMDTVTITLTSNGKQEWLINAERAKTGKSDRIIEMEVVNARYIGKGKAPTHIVSRQGQYLIDDRHLILIDDVVISKPETKEVLYTDLLHYYDATKMAVSPGEVELQGPSFRLEGGRMDYDLSTDGYDFSNRVKVDL